MSFVAGLYDLLMHARASPGAPVTIGVYLIKQLDKDYYPIVSGQGATHRMTIYTPEGRPDERRWSGTTHLLIWHESDYADHQEIAAAIDLDGFDLLRQTDHVVRFGPRDWAVLVEWTPEAQHDFWSTVDTTDPRRRWTVFHARIEPIEEVRQDGSC